MSPQGCEGVSSFCCIKWNFTKEEWKSPNNQGQMLTIDDLTNNALATEILVQKQLILCKIFPSDTVIPDLHCEIVTVNDKLYKNIFAKYC